MEHNQLLRLLHISIAGLALIVVTCRSAPAIGTPTQARVLPVTPTSQPTAASPRATATKAVQTATWTTTPGASPSATATLPPRPTPTFLPITPTIVGDTSEAHLVLAFFTAFNAGKLDAALGLLADDAGMGDCDFLTNQPVAFRSKEGAFQWVRADASVNEWLRERIADHDQLMVGQISVGDPSDGAARDVVQVEFARRINDSLRRIGYPDGITNNLGAKVVLMPDHKHIAGMPLGPGFQSTSTCYQRFGITRQGGKNGRSIAQGQ